MKATSSILQVPIITQKTDSDCGIACVSMVLEYYKANNRGITSLSSGIDGVQVRTIESFLREKGFAVCSGNMDMQLIKHFIKQKIPVITLLDNHYIIIKGFENRKIIYNDPMKGEIYESQVKFNKRWFNISDGAHLINWGIVAW